MSICISQSPVVPRGDQSYHTYDRLEIMNVLDTTLFNASNAYFRHELIATIKNAHIEKLTSKDIYNIKHIIADNIEYTTYYPPQTEEISPYLFYSTIEDTQHNEQTLFERSLYERKGFLKYFYNDKSNFFKVLHKDYSIVVNPIIHFGLHNDTQEDKPIFQNTRGIEVRGLLDKKVYFYSQLLENQRSFPTFVEERASRFKSLHGQNLAKPYQSTIFPSISGYDYFTVRGYFGVKVAKQINLEFGHSNFQVGNGIRSVLLSDFSSNYLFLRIDTKLWKFHYQNLFSELMPTSHASIQGDVLLPKKYFASHLLSFKASKNFEIAAFETVIFSRDKYFEFQYLNPIIFYRSVEHSLGSPDNVMLGLNAKWNFLRRFSLYGQLLVDEFKLSFVKNNNGWWGNKFGIQTGMKYINVFGIDQLDVQIEHNRVTPYTYTHRDELAELTSISVANYSTNNQPLAHILGANFKETVMVARYKPMNKVYMMTRYINSTYGEDEDNINWGGNILRNYTDRPTEFGNYIGQGIKNKVEMLQLDITYEARQNLFIDFQSTWRKHIMKEDIDQRFIFGIGLRLNIADLRYDY